MQGLAGNLVCEQVIIPHNPPHQTRPSSPSHRAKRGCHLAVWRRPYLPPPPIIRSPAPSPISALPSDSPFPLPVPIFQSQWLHPHPPTNNLLGSVWITPAAAVPFIGEARHWSRGYFLAAIGLPATQAKPCIGIRKSQWLAHTPLVATASSDEHEGRTGRALVAPLLPPVNPTQAMVVAEHIIPRSVMCLKPVIGVLGQW